MTADSHSQHLVAGSQAHYEDPGYYTKTYRDRLEDVQFYVEQALRSGGPVLEYGAGNGRIALPLARHGISVVGVDLSEAMLTSFRARLDGESDEVRKRIQLRRGDMRVVRLKRKFPLVICTFNTILHLYTRRDIESFFRRVREHLAPGGRFIVDLSVPHPEDLARDPSKAHHAPRFRHPTLGEVVKYKEYFDYNDADQVLSVQMHFEPISGRSKPWSTPLTHRQYFPQEFEALLHYNGFRVVRVDGDFSGNPLDRTSDVMVWQVQSRKGFEPEGRRREG